MIDFGEPVIIKGMGEREIIRRVEPLDLIVWSGHVIIVLDKARGIESRLDYDKDSPGSQGGVRIRGLSGILSEIMEKRKPADDYAAGSGGGKKAFVIRRWHK